MFEPCNGSLVVIIVLWFLVKNDWLYVKRNNFSRLSLQGKGKILMFGFVLCINTSLVS